MPDLTPTTTAPTPLRATLIGGVAIVMWATLAVLTTMTGAVPPLQLVAMAFAVAFALALVKWLARGERIRAHLAQAPSVWALGVGGLFGYHALYFLALKTAPVAEANLVNYLWPLLIVLFSAALPGERLRWFHLAAALLGLLGVALVVGLGAGAGVGGGGSGVPAAHVIGYLAALGAALVWAGYSVLSRRVAHVPTDAVGGFCGATAVLAALAHLAFETTVWPSGPQWLAVAALALGPVGLAFFAWDVGVKRGDIRALAALAYATPVLATALLVAAGRAAATWGLAAAALLVAGGAVLASRGLLAGRPRSRPKRA